MDTRLAFIGARLLHPAKLADTLLLCQGLSNALELRRSQNLRQARCNCMRAGVQPCVTPSNLALWSIGLPERHAFKLDSSNGRISAGL